MSVAMLASALCSLPLFAAAAEPTTTTLPPSTAPSTTATPDTTVPVATTEPAGPAETSLSVGDEAAYRAALASLSADASGPHAIELTADITVDDGTDPTYTGDQDLTIDGHGFTLDAAATSRLVVVDSPTDAQLRLVDITLQNGNADGDGGAVLVLNDSTVFVADARFHANEASGSGGAIEFPLAAFVTRSEFTDNVAAAGDGGALDAAAPAGRLLLRQSQFVDNRAPAGDGGAVSAIGFGSISSSDGVRDSTFAGNSARRGGGLVLDAGMVIADSTIVDNRAAVSGGGILGVNGGISAGIYLTVTGNAAPEGANISSLGRDLYLLFSVFAEPVGGDNCFFVGSRVVNDDHADDHSCGGGSFGGAAGLGPLTDNGGRTLTREPLLGSPLIDAIAAGYGFPSLEGGCARFLSLDPVDQRGVLRPQDGDGETRSDYAQGEPIEIAADCDIGAVEAHAFVAPPPPGPVPAGPPFTG